MPACGPSVFQVSEELCALGIASVPYHAGMSNKERLQSQCKWKSGEAQA